MLEHCLPWRASSLCDLYIRFPLADVRFSAVCPCIPDPDCGLPLRNGANNRLMGWLDQRGLGGEGAFPFFYFSEVALCPLPRSIDL